jgi:hypothetical protein
MASTFPWVATHQMNPSESTVIINNSKKKKKLEPFIELVGKGPQMSQCINSKRKQVTGLLCRKGNLCYFARGQTVQTLFESQGMEGTR